MFNVILSGGVGTRLWPVSRESRPKPFVKLADGQMLIEKTYARAKMLGSEILTVTNRDYYFISRDAQNLAGVDGSFLLEPFGRNTAPAIALAALAISSSKGADTVMLILSADHLVADQKNFELVVNQASSLAALGLLVTFGIEPTSPETGFGYIEKGEVIESGYRVARFVEKPDRATAESYAASGKHLWNSGMFCFKAGVFLEELAKHAPDVMRPVSACWYAMQPLNNSDMAEIPANFFKDVPDISIDYAVMQKSNKIAVVPGCFGWNDIGSWSAVRDLVKADARQNRAQGEVIFMDTNNTFVQSESRLVATVGISDLMIIDTPDALLVAHEDKSQDVKRIAAQLKSDGHNAYKYHRKVSRPWGTYTVLEEGHGFKIKRIEVNPSASLSLQMHRYRSEHWVVVKGTAKITNGDKEIVVQVNESAYIPAGQKHRLENPSNVPCVMIEVQCGEYLGEDDIVRFEDKYGRQYLTSKCK